jgi:hypothetical protein
MDLITMSIWFNFINWWFFRSIKIYFKKISRFNDSIMMCFTKYIWKSFWCNSWNWTLKSYGHVLNKYQITVLVSFEIKSINYGIANNADTGINTLTRRYILKIFNNK